MPEKCPTCGRERSSSKFKYPLRHSHRLGEIAQRRFLAGLAAGGIVPVKPRPKTRKPYNPADYKRWVEEQSTGMAGHRPWPPDPTLGAFDHDEANAARDRGTKSKKDRKKPFTIECRLIPADKEPLIHTFGLDQWFVHGRYTSGTIRDLAFTLLVTKAEHEMKGWGNVEWRKVG